MKVIQNILGYLLVFALGIGVFGTGISLAQESKSNTRVFELRTYTVLPGRLTALNKRFAEHTMKLFERHGIRSEAYWTPIDDARKDNTLIYIVSHESQDAVDRNWKEFAADPDWIKARDESEIDGKILAKPPEKVFMLMTGYSPNK